MIDHGDDMIEAIADALRPLPRVDDAARARVLIAVAAEREREREASRRRASWRRSYPWIAASGIAAASVALVAFVLATPRVPTPPVSGAASQVSPVAAAQLAADAPDSDVRLVPVQLVLRAPAAANVRVVGDFNEWDRERLPMTRDAETGLWSVTLSLRPGRHVYAFVVDDSIWMRDPRANAAPDADFGRPGSVLLVGRP